METKNGGVTTARVPDASQGAGGPPVDARDAPGLAARFQAQAGFGLIEALVAIVIFALGTLVVAGLALAAGHYATKASIDTDQSLVASQLFAELRQEDFGVVASGTQSLSVGDHVYSVDVVVAQPSADVKSVEAVVAGVGPFSPDTFRTRLHRSGGYPSSP